MKALVALVLGILTSVSIVCADEYVYDTAWRVEIVRVPQAEPNRPTKKEWKLPKEAKVTSTGFCRYIQGTEVKNKPCTIYRLPHDPADYLIHFSLDGEVEEVTKHSSTGAERIWP
jgi:hypothetical protein